MKYTGIVRKINDLGRIVLPKELRDTLGIYKEDELEIYVNGTMVILKKYEPSCLFCSDTRDVVDYKGRNICSKCLVEFKKVNL